MSTLASKDGYAQASIARVIAHAGVSRPTFYNYFPDREACFLAAHREHATHLHASVSASVDRQDPARSLGAALEAIVEFARSEPMAARLLMHESTAAGSSTLRERDRAISGLALIVEQRRMLAGPTGLAADVYVPAVIGSVYRLLSLRLRRGERDLESTTRHLQGWLAAYERPTSEHRWGTLENLQGPPAPPTPKDSLYPPPPLPSGRAALSPEQVAHNHRERILYACLQCSAEQGYSATSVAAITAVAHVDKRIFYQHFRDKQDAFHATLEHAFQPTIAATATAFFSAPTWPQRVWEAGGALTRLLAANQALAHFAFIDVYTVGPTAVTRFEDLRSAYTIFLQEGRQHPTSPVSPPSDAALEAIAATVFEITYNQIRLGRSRQLTRLLPHVAYLCLTPFLGIQATEEFIDAKRCVAPIGLRGR